MSDMDELVAQDQRQGLGDWRPRIERIVLGVLYRRGVVNAAELATECAEELYPVVRSVRNEQMEFASERVKDMAEKRLFGREP